ncbi:MAG: hypothetical protein ACK56I_29115, partial [bacterium]
QRHGPRRACKKEYGPSCSARGSLRVLRRRGRGRAQARGGRGHADCGDRAPRGITRPTMLV